MEIPYQSGPYWIMEAIESNLFEHLIRADGMIVILRLPQGSIAAQQLVYPTRGIAFQILHEFAQISGSQFGHKVYMIGHDHSGVKANPSSRA